MPNYILDTGVISRLLLKKQNVLDQISALNMASDEIYITAAILIELLNWAEKERGRERTTRSQYQIFKKYINSLQKLPITDETDTYFEIFADTEYTIGVADVFNGCLAIQHEAIFVTLNDKHFGRFIKEGMECIKIVE